jgi:D-ribose pyranose/furanose isomerase RbsD
MKSTMRSLLVIAASTLAAGGLTSSLLAQKAKPWQSKVAELLPLLGHRNWILIVDSAYPLQTSPGIETIETNDGQLDVVRQVLGQIDHSIHVRPNVYMDAELPFVKEQDAPGVIAYRRDIKALLGKRPVQSLPHDQIISKVEETSKSFHILVLKTNMAIPYSSVFLQLDCKYWPEGAEQRLRHAMLEAEKK